MGLDRLSRAQRACVGEWMPGAEVVADLSWNLADTVVLHVRERAGDAIVKAASPRNHHFARELAAYESGLVDAWTSSGHAPRLRFADHAARVMVMDRLPGDLVYRTTAATDPAVHRRAGELLRAFHDQEVRVSEGTDAADTRRALAWLDSAHAIAPEVEEKLRAALDALPPVEAPLVATHGDWQPRNWLVDGGEVRVIDFGRFAFRPAATDFTRLAAQEWRAAPECEEAFLAGYGRDPRHPSHWLLMRVREAVGTAAWAHQVGDAEFEAQGHRMISEALAALDG